MGLDSPDAVLDREWSPANTVGPITTFTFHGPTCTLHFHLKDGAVVVERVFDPTHHRYPLLGERYPLPVIHDHELIVRTDWEAMLRTASEDKLRGEEANSP